MEKLRLIYEGTLPGLNEYTESNRSGYRQGAKFKRQTEEDLIWIFKSQFKGQLNGLYNVDFVWIEKDKRRDHDNICSARKFIFDALVKSGILPDDNWRYIGNFTDTFLVDKEKPRVELYLWRQSNG